MRQRFGLARRHRTRFGKAMAMGHMILSIDGCVSMTCQSTKSNIRVHVRMMAKHFWRNCTASILLRGYEAPRLTRLKCVYIVYISVESRCRYHAYKWYKIKGVNAERGGSYCVDVQQKRMRMPGFEPGISPPQGEVLTTILHTPGEAGYRSQYLSHAKRALYHLSYIPVQYYTHHQPNKFSLHQKYATHKRHNTPDNKNTSTTNYVHRITTQHLHYTAGKLTPHGDNHTTPKLATRPTRYDSLTSIRFTNTFNYSHILVHTAYTHCTHANLSITNIVQRVPISRQND
jgi:hypothetical protein